MNNLSIANSVVCRPIVPALHPVYAPRDIVAVKCAVCGTELKWKRETIGQQDYLMTGNCPVCFEKAVEKRAEEKAEDVADLRCEDCDELTREREKGYGHGYRDGEAGNKYNDNF